MSPSLGRWADGNLGGFFGAELRRAGWNQIWLEGISEKPVLIYIENQNVKCIDAGHLWGRGVYDTTEWIREEFGPDAQSLVIGPAGETQVAYACVMSGDRAAGGGGIGAVLGRMKVKGIVVRGTLGLEPAQPDKFMDACMAAHKQVRSNPLFGEFSESGTSIITTIYKGVKALPVNYWNEGDSPHAKNFEPGGLKDRVEKSRACYGCTIHCSHQINIGFEETKLGAEFEGAEYEALNGLGLKIGITDLDDCLRLIKRFNDLGLDVVQTSGVLGMLMKMTEDGFAMNMDQIKFGDVEAVWNRIDRWVYDEERERYFGFWNGLDAGFERYRQIFPPPRLDEQINRFRRKYSVDIKNSMPPSLDFRVPENFAATIACMTSTRGADHLRSLAPIEAYGQWYGREDLEAMALPFGIPSEVMEEWLDLNGFDPKINSKSRKGKVAIISYFQDQNAVTDALGICRFASSWRMGVGLELMAEMVSSFLGHTLSWEGLQRVGKRITAVERTMNCLIHKMDKYDDYPPEKFFAEPLNKQSLSHHDVRSARDFFYEYNGYDENGCPTKETQEDLGIKWDEL
jgi:aldehyde:ferredoxin oxidoreductase